VAPLAAPNGLGLVEEYRRFLTPAAVQSALTDSLARLELASFQIRTLDLHNYVISGLLWDPNRSGEALRDDEHYTYVAAWEFTGVGKKPELHKEHLAFEYVKPSQRSYK
jgi:hypothetical protein